MRCIAVSGEVIATDRGPISVTTASIAGEINNKGQAAVLLGGPESSIVLNSGQEYRVIAAEGDAIGNERILYLTNRFALSGGSEVVYEAAMIGGDAIPNQTRMLLRNAPAQSPLIIARTLTPAPGASNQLVFSPYFGDFAVNGRGQVALSSGLVDAVTGELTARGIWVEDNHKSLQPVIITGDLIDVDSGPGVDLRQVVDVRDIGTGGNQVGLSSRFNDLGQVAFVASFADGSQALLVSASTVPEPSGSVLGLLCFAFFGPTLLTRSSTLGRRQR